ncbi:MAG: histidine kinase dimerization/phospho-acceptor domain-containing protein, partial [Thermodesulfobacteriota bacterium]
MSPADHNDLFRLITTSRDKFRTLVDGLEDVVLSISPEGNIVTLNAALARDLDRHPREIVGRKCHEVLYGLDRPCPELDRPCPAERARRTGRVEVVMHGLPFEAPADEKERFIEARAMPLGVDKDLPDDIILVRRDITLQKKAEIQLQEHSRWLEKEVRKRTAELVEANEELTRQRNELAAINAELVRLQVLKEDLTNMVVHDLKGPLAEIQANLEMMGLEPANELQAEFVEAARLGADDLLRMITNLLDVSRLEENRLVLEFSQFDAGRRLFETKTRFGPLARLSEVTIETETDPDLPPLVADERLFERILNNLVSNALNYTPPSGRITLKAGFENG